MLTERCYFRHFTTRRLMTDTLELFSCIQPVLHDGCNKGRGICYPVIGMVHIKEPLLLIGRSSPCWAAGFLSRGLNSSLP